MSKNKLYSFPWSDPEGYASSREYTRREMERLHEWIMQYIDVRNQSETESTSSISLTAVEARVTVNEADIVTLEAHPPLSSSVHGVSGTVVGTTDSQSLESKTIGTTAPQPGHFDPLVVANELTGDFTVPAGRTMIVPTGFTITADLTLTGDLQVA